MFLKACSITLCVGACACSLLAMRQSRLQVASELAQAQLRIQAADERLWLLRTDVAGRVSPQSVDRMARALGPLKPIVDSLPVTRLASNDPQFQAAPPEATTPGTPSATPGVSRPVPREARAKPAAAPSMPDRRAERSKPARQMPTRTQPAKLAHRGGR